MHVIDVGQGTAVLLQKGDRGLLYDVGPVYGSFNATEAYVLPYLHYQGVRQLDYLVLSHADTDHTGAFAEVLKAYPGAQLIADFDNRLPAASLFIFASSLSGCKAVGFSKSIPDRGRQ